MKSNSCSYENVCSNYDNICSERSWKPFFRQMLISSAMWTCYFTYGMFLGTPTVLIPYERKLANSTDVISKDMASWLTAVYGYISIPWTIALPILVKVYGRKKPYIFITLNTIVGSIVFLSSQTIMQVLISEMMHGVMVASNVTIAYLILTEYTSPKYRGLFLTFKSASFFWGIWVANAIGTFFHWKNVGIVALILMAYNLVTIFCWCESPYWLARKQKFDECAAAHYWLKGYSNESRDELKDMIKEQKNRIQKTDNDFSIEYIKSIVNTLFLKEVYKPLFISLLVLAMYFTTGKVLCSIYAIEIFKRISGEDAAYKGMLILDGVTVFAMYVASGLSRMFKRRTLFFGATCLGILFLFCMSLYLYLIKLGVLSEKTYISLALLSAYSIAICCGPMILSTSIVAELVPIKARSTSVCLSAMGMKIMLSTYVKLAPYIFDWFGMHGTFLFYGIGSSFFLFILYFYLPETKDKTILQITDSMTGAVDERNNDIKELLSIDKHTDKDPSKDEKDKFVF